MCDCSANQVLNCSLLHICITTGAHSFAGVTKWRLPPVAAVQPTTSLTAHWCMSGVCITTGACLSAGVTKQRLPSVAAVQPTMSLNAHWCMSVLPPEHVCFQVSLNEGCHQLQLFSQDPNCSLMHVCITTGACLFALMHVCITTGACLFALMHVCITTGACLFPGVTKWRLPQVAAVQPGPNYSLMHGCITAGACLFAGVMKQRLPPVAAVQQTMSLNAHWCMSVLQLERVCFQVSLNEGCHQLRLFSQGPNGVDPFTESCLRDANVRIIPCASMLVRLYKVPRGPKGKPLEVRKGHNSQDIAGTSFLVAHGPCWVWLSGKFCQWKLVYFSGEKIKEEWLLAFYLYLKKIFFKLV